VVDFGQVECSGLSEVGASVLVNGQPVDLKDKAFASSIPLPVVGEYKIQVVARMKGKAPHTETVTIKRVEDLSLIISEWAGGVNKSLTYQVLSRDPGTHAGKKIKIDGQIVNINAERGVTAFLLYVTQGCPKGSGARCAVYVIYRGEMKAKLHSWVSVYAKVRGTRAVDLPGGSKLHVPAVDAAFVRKKNKLKGR